MILVRFSCVDVQGKCLVKILCLWDNATSCPSCPIMPSKCASKCTVGNGMCCACLWIFSWTVTSLLVNHRQTVFQVYTVTFHLKGSWVGHGVVTCLCFAFGEECQILCLNTEPVCVCGCVLLSNQIQTDWKCVWSEDWSWSLCSSITFGRLDRSDVFLLSGISGLLFNSPVVFQPSPLVLSVLALF